MTSCSEGKSKRIATIHQGSYTIKATLVGNKRTGITEVFDGSNKLTGILHYENDILSGSCVHYFPNGVVSDSVYYECNQTQGYWRHFFPDGTPRHINYYYYGLEFGPDLWYDKDAILRTYQFLDFNRAPIVICSYNSHGNIDSLKEFNLSLMVEDKVKNGVPDFQCFAYLPQIPLAKQVYYFGIADKNHKNMHKICNIEGHNFLIDTVLQAPPPGYHFYLGCDLKTDDGVLDETFMVEAIKK